MEVNRKDLKALILLLQLLEINEEEKISSQLWYKEGETRQ